MAKPYITKKIQPIKLINLKVIMFFMNIEIPIKIDAAYPTYSIHGILSINSPLSKNSIDYITSIP